LPVRLIEVIANRGHTDTIFAIAERFEALDCRAEPPAKPDGEPICRILARPEKQQELLDQLQTALGVGKPWRIVILPIEATIPEPESPEEKPSPETAIREKLYEEVAQGARADSTFILLVLFSTVVAAIGLMTDNLAVVIGAMLIAPLLGPNMALAFASALGDRELLLRAAMTNLIGVGLTIAAAGAAGLVLANPYSSHELMARTIFGYDSVALALASGAAGALSFTTGIPATLVGVMVAVALLPPAATLGYMLTTDRLAAALGAGELLAINIVCVNLAAQLVFLAKGIKPRTWFERRAAKQSTIVSVAIWSVLLAALVATIWSRQIRP
jgi:uncharacterized hydrophobic protein (TIGR00341 family)